MDALASFLTVLTTLFRAVFQASWQGALAILLVVMVRRAFGTRVPARWHYLLWFLVLARLLLPTSVLPRSPASLESLLSTARPLEKPTVAQQPLSLPRNTVPPLEQRWLLPLMASGQPVWQAAAPASTPHLAWTWWNLAASVWLSGLLLAGGWLAVCMVELHRRLERETFPVAEPIGEIWRACCRRWLRKTVPYIRSAGWVESPVLVGGWRPTLLVPRRTLASFTREDWEHVFAHEIAHLRWRDHQSQWMILAAWCLHWFNPVVFLGFRRLRADRELAADEWVLRHLAEERTLAYGETLFKTVAERSAQAGLQPSAIGISEDGMQMQQRLRHIVAFLPGRRVWGSLAGLGALLVLGQGTVAPETSPKPGARAAKNPMLSPTPDSRQITAEPARQFQNDLLAAARSGDGARLEHLLDDSWKPPGRFSKEAAVQMLDAALRDQDLTVFVTLHDALKKTPYGNDWKPGDKQLIGLVKAGRIDFLEALLVRRLDPARLSAQVANSDAQTAAWITRRVAEAGKQRADVEALGRAAREGDLPGITRLLEAGVDINAVDGEENTPLIEAVFKNRVDAARLLLERGALVDKVRYPGWNYTPLTFAQSVEMAQLLKDHGANLQANLWGRDVNLLVYVVQHSKAEVVDWFLQQGLNARMLGDNQENLLFGLEDGDMAEVLLQAGADPNAVSGFGRPVIASAQSAAVVRALVRHGADLKPKLKDGATLLEYAVTSTQRQNASPDQQGACIEELIKQGTEFDPAGNGVRAMLSAAFHDRVGMVRVFLDHGVSPNAAYDRTPSEHETALSNAAMQAPKSLKLLLERGADPNAPFPAGQSNPLGCALAWGNFEGVDLLRRAGAKGLSDLAYFSAKGDASRVGELLDQHADPNEVDSSGWTPLRYAVRHAEVEVARRLLDHGASVDPFDGWGFSPYLDYVLYKQMIERDPGQAQTQWHLPPDEAKVRLAGFQVLFTQHPPNSAYRDPSGRTALQQAVWSGNSLMSGLMLTGKPPLFDPNLPDGEGRTPLLLAALSPMAKDIKGIFFVGKDSPQQKNWNAQAFLADELLKAGARIDLVGPGGKTVGELALAAAREAGNSQLAEVLTDAMREQSGVLPAPPAPAASATPEGSPAAKARDGGAAPALPTVEEPAPQRSPASDRDINTAGRVFMADGTPLGDAPILARTNATKGMNGTSGETIPVLNGTFPLQLDKGTTSATVAVAQSGCAPTYVGPFDGAHLDKFQGLHVELTRGYAATVQIVDAAGQPVAGARLRSYCPGPPTVELAETVTDAAGRAVIEHLPTVPLNIRVLADGFEADEATGLRLDPLKPYHWTLHPTMPLPGTVVDAASGQPVTGAVIKLAGVRGPFNESWYDPKQAPVLTNGDASGQFVLRSLRPDSRYYLFVEAPGHGGAILRGVQLAQGRLRVVLGPELTIRGRITHAPPSVIHLGKMYLGYGQAFAIGDGFYGVVSQTADLVPDQGEASFSVGPFYKAFNVDPAEPKGFPPGYGKPIALHVDTWALARFDPEKLPVADFVFDLAKRSNPRDPTLSKEEAAALEKEANGTSAPAKGQGNKPVDDGQTPAQATRLPEASPSPGSKLEPAKPRTVSLSGVVTDATTGAPIAGGAIKLNGTEDLQAPSSKLFGPAAAATLATTDERGHFKVDNLRQDIRYWFFVEASGHGGAYLALPTLPADELQVKLGPERFIRGRIIHAPASMIHDGKLALSFSQELFKNPNEDTWTTLVLEPQDGAADFVAGPFYEPQGTYPFNKAPVTLRVDGKAQAYFRADGLPKAGYILNLSPNLGHLDGEYKAEANSPWTLDLRKDGVAYCFSQGSRYTARYELSGDEVTFTFPDGMQDHLQVDGTDLLGPTDGKSLWTFARLRKR